MFSILKIVIICNYKFLLSKKGCPKGIPFVVKRKPPDYLVVLLRFTFEKVSPSLFYEFPCACIKPWMYASIIPCSVKPFKSSLFPCDKLS